MSLWSIKKIIYLVFPLVLAQIGCKLPFPSEGEQDSPLQTFPLPPTVSTVESISETSLKLSWGSAYGYPVFIQRSDPVHPFATIAFDTVTSYFIDSTVNKNFVYTYRLAAVGSGDTSSFSEPTIIKYAATNKLIQQIQNYYGMSAIAFSDNSSLIATIENGIVIRNYSDLSVYSKIDTWSGISIDFSNDGSMIAMGYSSAFTFNTLNASQILNINVDSSFVQKLWFINSDRQLFGVLQPMSGRGQYGSAFLWDAKTGTMVRHIDSLLDIYPNASTISGDRKTILLGVQNQTIKFTIDTSIISSVLDKGTTFYSLALTGNGEHFIGSESEQISYYTTSSGAQIRTIDKNLYVDAYYLAISPDDSLLLASDYLSYQVRVYNIATGALIRIINASNNSTGYVSGLQFSNDGQSFIVISGYGMMSKYSRSELSYSWQKLK